MNLCQAYQEGKKPVAQTDVEKPAIPEDLVCSLCNDLLTDAVMIPCCGNSFCDDCIRTVLLESENHQCPDCKECSVSPDTLIPNRFLRTNVNNFKSQTGYSRAAPVQSRVAPQPSQPDQSYQPQAVTPAPAPISSAVPEAVEVSRPPPPTASGAVVSVPDDAAPPKQPIPLSSGQPIQDIDSLHSRTHYHGHSSQPSKEDRPSHISSHHSSHTSSSHHSSRHPHSSSNHHFPIPTTNSVVDRVPPGVAVDDVIVTGEIVAKQSMRGPLPPHQRLPMEERSGTPTVDERSAVPGATVIPDTSLPPPCPVQATYQIPSYPPPTHTPAYGQSYGAPPMSGPPMHHSGGYPPRVMPPPYASHPAPHGQVYSMDHVSRGELDTGKMRFKRRGNQVVIEEKQNIVAKYRSPIEPVYESFNNGSSGMRSYRGGYSRPPRSRGMHSGYHRGAQNGSQLTKT